MHRILSVLAFLFIFLVSGCGGLGDTDTLGASVDTAGKTVHVDAAPELSGNQAQPGQIEVSIGMSADRILRLLGQADSITPADNGRETWTYNGKRADFIYAAGQDLIIGGYVPRSREGSLTVMIVFDADRKVTDFTYVVLPL
jgi:hypothetical protein